MQHLGNGFGDPVYLCDFPQGILLEKRHTSRGELSLLRINAWQPHWIPSHSTDRTLLSLVTSLVIYSSGWSMNWALGCTFWGPGLSGTSLTSPPPPSPTGEGGSPRGSVQALLSCHSTFSPTFYLLPWLRYHLRKDKFINPAYISPLSFDP